MSNNVNNCSFVSAFRELTKARWEATGDLPKWQRWTARIGAALFAPLLLADTGARVARAQLKNRTLITHAIKTRDVNWACRLVENAKNPDLNVRDQKGRTALHLAVEKGCTKMIKLLVQKGADVKAQDQKGRTPLDIALSLENLQAVQELIEAGASGCQQSIIKLALEQERTDLLNVWFPNPERLTISIKEQSKLLFQFIQAGQIGFMPKLTQEKFAVNSLNDKGNTPLMEAIEQGREDMALLLLAEKNIHVHTRNDREETALHIAARKNMLSVVNLLIENGAKIDEISRQGHTPLQLTTNPLIQILLLRKGADPYRNSWLSKRVKTICNAEDRAVLQVALEQGEIHKKIPLIVIASANGDAESVQLLLDHGADVNIQDELGATALVEATYKNNIKTVELLLDHGADVNIRPKVGNTALVETVYKNDIKTVQLLLDHGADVNIQTDKGDTALINAVHRGNREIVELLLKHGADVNKLGNRDGGGTALNWAAFRRHYNIVRLLVERGADLNLCRPSNLRGFPDFPLRWLVQEEQYDLVQLLLESGALLFPNDPEFDKICDTKSDEVFDAKLRITYENASEEMRQFMKMIKREVLAQQQEAVKALPELLPHDLSDLMLEYVGPNKFKAPRILKSVGERSQPSLT